MLKKLAALALAGILLGGCSQGDKDKFQESAKKAGETTKEDLKKVGTKIENGMSAAKIKSVLAASKKLDASHIDVEKRNDDYVMRGTITSEEQHELALRIVKDTVGPKENVVDEMKVEGSTSSPTPK